MGEVGCLLGSVALLLGFMGCSVLTDDMAEVVKKIRVSSGFGLQVMPVGYLGVSGLCALQIYFGTRCKLA